MTSSAHVTTQDCVGPIAIPAESMRALHDLAQDARADDLVAFSVCAWVVAGRLSPRTATGRVRVIQGLWETITPAAMAPADSFRDALRRAGELPLTATRGTADQHTDATILISPDGSRLYAESTAGPADAPAAGWWARTFVRLLAGLTADPDRPMTELPVGDEPAALAVRW